MSFDWIGFLNAERIPFIDEGAQTSKGWISLKCPLCGDDPREALGINLETGGWSCWRDRKRHKSGNPVPLVKALLGCSWQQAYDRVGVPNLNPQQDIESKVMNMLAPPPSVAPERLVLLPEFRDFETPPLPASRPFLRYLKNRGYTLDAAIEYGLKYCMTGPYRYRFIFPVHYNGQLVSWTGRTIIADPLRYKTLSPDPDKAAAEGMPLAHGPTNHYLLWFDQLRDKAQAGFHTLVLCEGPMDAWKVSILGERSGICSTCFFGAEPTDEQVELLYAIEPCFETKVMLLDRGAESKTMEVARRLCTLGVKSRFMLLHRKDPGDLRTPLELVTVVKGVR